MSDEDRHLLAHGARMQFDVVVGAVAGDGGRRRRRALGTTETSDPYGNVECSAKKCGAERGDENYTEQRTWSDRHDVG